MDINETKAALEVMQAFVNGRAVQSTPFRTNGWRIDLTPSWDWHGMEYRIKPEPKIIYVVERNRATESAYEVETVLEAFLSESVAKIVANNNGVLTPTPYVLLSDVELLK